MRLVDLIWIECQVQTMSLIRWAQRRSGRAFLMWAALVAIAGRAAASEAVPAHPVRRYVIIHAGVLLADARKPPEHRMSVIVEGDRIKSVQPGFVDGASLSRAASVRIVDLSNSFVMAGLIDMHTHIAFPAPNLVGALKHLRTLVRGGATTIRDAGSAPETIFPLKDAVDQGFAEGPRIFPSGALLTITGGHGDFRNGDFQAASRPPLSGSEVCDGVAECAKAARRQVQLGATQVKIIVTAGVSDNSNTGLDQQFSQAELDTIVQTAHLLHRPVMAHAHGEAGIRAALSAGVDTIEHGTFLDAVEAEDMGRRHIFLTPTLGTVQAILDEIAHPEPGAPPVSANTAAKVHLLPASRPGPIEVLRLATRHQVPLLTGSDGGYPVTNEVQIFVERGGLTPAQALAAATVNGAEALGASKDIGTIETGKAADIIAFDRNPLLDIAAMRTLGFVMAQGTEICGRAEPCLSGAPSEVSDAVDLD